MSVNRIPRVGSGAVSAQVSNSIEPATIPSTDRPKVVFSSRRRSGIARIVPRKSSSSTSKNPAIAESIRASLQPPRHPDFDDQRRSRTSLHKKAPTIINRRGFVYQCRAVQAPTRPKPSPRIPEGTFSSSPSVPRAACSSASSFFDPTTILRNWRCPEPAGMR